MALPKVTFTLGQGGLGRPLTGFDHYSIMRAYYYASSANTDYAGIGSKIYYSVADAEADGVVNTHTDATAAEAILTVSTAGTNGDVVTITVDKWDGTTITLGTYTKVNGDNTATLVATAIVAAVNARTYLTGFSATVGSTGAFTLIAPKSWGTHLNTVEPTVTIVGSTMAITNDDFEDGEGSNLAIFHYQISEFFRANPQGVLYFSIGFDDSANAVTTFNTQVSTEVLADVNKFNGNARQILVYNPFRTFATSTLNTLKSLRTTLLAQYTPSVFLYGGKYSSTLSSQVNLRALSDDGVGAVLGQSMSGKGLELYYTQQTVVLSAGLALGIQSIASVSQSIGEVQSFNLADGVECEEVGFFDGSKFREISTALADQLHDYGWIFPMTYVGVSGAYFNASNASVSPTSDYAYLSDSRTIDKAIRGTYANIVTLLNSRNLVNANGTLAEAAIATYDSKASAALQQMVNDGDLNDYRVYVDRTEVVTTTSNVSITLELQPVGTTRTITIKIGFKATLV